MPSNLWGFQTSLTLSLKIITIKSPFIHLVFDLKHLCNLYYYMGIEVEHQNVGSILLSHFKYIHEFLFITDLKDASAMTVHMVFSANLTNSSFVEATLYCYFLGSRQYSIINLLELNYIVNKVCQFMAHTLEDWWTFEMCTKLWSI